MKNGFSVMFIVFEILAIASCLILIFVLWTPILFIITDDEYEPSNYQLYGVFKYYINNKVSMIYEDSTTSFFKIIQFSFLLSAILAVISTIFTLSGSMYERFIVVSVFLHSSTATSLIIFSVLYSIQYYRITHYRTFIFGSNHDHPKIFEIEYVVDSILLVLIWPITLIFTIFAWMLLCQLFCNRKIEKQNERKIIDIY
ncbi:hypothetical protein RF11_15023 [Thelohanellus kitauei]|uniref:Uncharacterized protein n=1 Tax=Thelohanellus kitauei TaxID=669202 RepID=A0A0C2IER1_THEKT|nr:hypothetical protein RF11_15023 [Thelohanellus kitauei]